MQPIDDPAILDEVTQIMQGRGMVKAAATGKV
jgi:hypothetical protein